MTPLEHACSGDNADPNACLAVAKERVERKDELGLREYVDKMVLAINASPACLRDFEAEGCFAAVVALVHAGRVPLGTLLERLTAGPVRTLSLDRRPGLEGLGTLQPGAPADVVLLDLDREWTVDANAFVSKGHNTPLDGFSLTGMVVATVAGGRVAWREPVAAGA